MTNVEYKKFATKELNEFGEMIDMENVHITHISEFFILKIREALLKCKKNENLYGIAKEIEPIFYKLFANKAPETKKNVLSPYMTSDWDSIEDRYQESMGMIFFRNIHFLANSFPNIEKTLSGIGIENPKILVSEVKNIKDISTDENRRKIQDIVELFEKDDDDNQKSFFKILSTYSQLRPLIFSLLGLDDFDKFILVVLKSIKNIVEEHLDIYIERLQKYNIIFNDFDVYLDKHAEAILRVFNKMVNKAIQENRFLEDGISVDDPEGSFSTALVMDFFFLLYYITYDTEFWIEIGFELTSEETSGNLRQTMIESLQDNKYSPIIQYEYGCFCKQNTCSSAPIQFYFGDSIDLESLNIEYLRLEQWNMDVNSYLFNKKRPTSNKIEIINRPNRDKIIHDLEPYLKVFDKRSSKERGTVFKKDYLSNVITLVENLKGSIAVHGFAYILYKSKFFNWGDEVFDNNFVEKIAEIFNIKHLLGTEYPLNKCQAKAENILKKNSNLQGLWD